MQRGCQRNAWRAFRSTCKSRRQNDKSACAKGDSRAHGRIARDSSVAKKPAVDFYRRKRGRDCTAGEDRLRCRTARQHHSLARENVGCDDVHRDGRVFYVAIGQMMVENTSEPIGWHEMTPPADET